MTETVEAVDLSTMTESPIPDEGPTEGSGITCETCGKDIGYMYAGRGRKPKYCEEHKSNRSASNLGSNSKRGSADVNAAVNTLDMGYQALKMLLMMTGAHGAMQALDQSLPGLREQNRTFLSQDKDLVKKINAAGKTGGRYAFFGAQIMVLGPVGVLAAQEYRERFASKVDVDTESDDDVPAFMGGVPLGDED